MGGRGSSEKTGNSLLPYVAYQNFSDPHIVAQAYQAIDWTFQMSSIAQFACPFPHCMYRFCGIESRKPRSVYTKTDEPTIL